MKRCLYMVCVAVMVLVITLFSTQAFSQDIKPKSDQEAQAPAGQATMRPVAVQPSPAPAAEAPKVNEVSIYGEVQAVNVQANSITAQYYDYDNDEERSAELSLDKDTKLENAKAIDEIKKGDWVDVTYVVSGGKNMAKLVSVEKEEPAMEENAPADTEE